MTAITGAQYRIETKELPEQQKNLERESQSIKDFVPLRILSIYNNTDEPIKVDFDFAYTESGVPTGNRYHEPANQKELTGERGGFTIQSRQWRHISIPHGNEYRPSRTNGISIDYLDRLKVAGKTIYSEQKNRSDQMFYLPSSIQVTKV